MLLNKVHVPDMQRIQIKQKVKSLEQRKVECRTKQEDGVAHAQKPQTSQWFKGEVFKRQYLGWGSRVCDFLLIGCWWGNRAVLQESTQAWICHPILHMGWGAEGWGLVLQRNTKILFWDFSGGPLSRTPCSQRRRWGSVPGQGTKIPHAATKDGKS